MSEIGEATIACGNCGAVNDAGARFCHSCGVLLAAYASARPQALVPEADEIAAPVASEEPGAAPGPAGPAAAAGAPPDPATIGGSGATGFAGWGDDIGTADDWLTRTAPDVEGGDAAFWDPARFGDAAAPTVPATPDPTRELAEPVIVPIAPPSDAAPDAPDSPAATLAAGGDAAPILEEPPGLSSSPAAERAERPVGGASSVGMSVPPEHTGTGATSDLAAPTPPVAKRTRWSAPPTTSLFPSGIGGGWLDRTSPRTIGLVGAALLLLSCVWFVGAGAADADGQAAFALFCLAPIGAIALVAGLVMLYVKRPRRRG